MTERLRISYGRKLTQQIGTDLDTSQLGGEWEFDVPDGADIQTEYGKGYAVLRTIVDGFFESKPTPKVLPGETIKHAERPALTTRAESSETPAGQPPADNEIVEGREYAFQNVRVWDVKKEWTKNNKPYVVMRVGSKEEIPGNGYARVKSFNPVMMRKVEALQQGDHIELTGVYEGWDGRDGRMFDFVPSHIEKVRNVRSD